ncbi:MAG: PD40 domain-containing protein [Anaerolineales bacterium]|nr:PD40 domain-containing protein [Anaerolineales bacterium]
MIRRTRFYTAMLAGLVLVLAAGGCGTADETQITATHAPLNTATSTPISTGTTTLTPTLTSSPTATATFTPTLVPEPISLGWIAFADGDSIDIIQTDGKGRRSIVDSVADFENLAWSPVGNWIAYSDAGQIYIVHPDGSGLRRLTYSQGHINSFSWSPDGQAIVFSQLTVIGEDSEVNLFVYELDIPNIRQLTNTLKISEFTPAYSPSGDTIAFISFGEKNWPNTSVLSIIAPDGTNTRHLFDPPMDVNSFSWSPDGNQIVISSNGEIQHQSPYNDLYIFNLQWGEFQHLIDDSENVDTHPAWSPDGEWVVFTRASCNYPAAPGFKDIYVIHVSDGEIRRISNTHKTLHPTWSPWESLQAGETFTLTSLGANLKLRSEPTLSGTVLDLLEEGERILVIEGPVEADEYLWYLVRVEENGDEGWVADNPGWFSINE